MTDGTTTTNTGGNKPVAYLYFAKAAARRGGKDRLIRIGAVFAHRSGKGRTHLIDALPERLSPSLTARRRGSASGWGRRGRRRRDRSGSRGGRAGRAARLRS